jgi:ABC-type multidrug transport system fused ATPase/permease subunit
MEFLSNENLFPDGFQTMIGERGSTLSGGQRQRICIARALMRKPKILIFDEATSALDSHSENLVKKSIEEIANQEQKITIIVVAHRLSTVINCDRLFVMKDGEIVENGNHRDLISQGGYY